MTLRDQLQNQVKEAMKSQDKPLLSVLRLMMAAIKQKEIDERITLDDSQILVILDKMVKQRRESISQYQAAKRDDLVKQEEYELSIIQRYLPEPLSEAELDALIKEAIASVDAKTMQDMGKVMALLKPQVQGRTDMGSLGNKIKNMLG